MMILSYRAMWAEWGRPRDVIRRAGLGTIPRPDGWVDGEDDCSPPVDACGSGR